MEGKSQKKKGINRRKFFEYAGVGIGLVLVIGYFTRNKWRQALDAYINSAGPPYQGKKIPNIWFQVTPSNEIILHSAKVEMGQGTFTGLAQIAADELEVDIDKIKVIHANTDHGPIDGFSTGGSTSIASLWMPMRRMASCMREMIRIQAATKWAVPVNTVTNENGVLYHGDQSMTYGEAVDGVTKWIVPEQPKLKNPDEYKYVGKPVPRVDLKSKVFGDPMFGMDAEMEDMLFASVTRPPVVDATLKSCDSSEAEKMPGVVKVVKEKDFVGVVAESLFEANNARLALKCEWDVKKVWQMKDIEDMIKVGAGCPFEIQSHGKAKKILDKAEEDGSLIKMEFNSPIGAHAQMEPNGAVAKFEDGKLTIKVSTQVVKITRCQIADRLGIKAKNVNVIPTYLGGGFGRRLETPTAVQTAVLAKAVGRPVKCFLDRQQEFQNDTFRPPTNHLLRATLDNEGNLEAFEHNVSSGDVMFGSPLVPAPAITETILGADFGAWRGGMVMYHNIPNYRAISWRVTLPFATSFWRSLGLLANTFAIESFLDELSLTAAKDPVQWRLDMCSDDETGLRLQAVIREAAEKSNYKNTPEGGRAMGFAASIDARSVCAHVAEVSIEDDRIKVHKVTCVFDCGVTVNPDQVKAQCEGCVIMGLSASMFEKMDLTDGELTPINYGAYQMAMMRDAPEIEVILLEGHPDPLPVGEPPLGPIGAAIGNAVRRLTGKRLTRIPLDLDE